MSPREQRQLKRWLRFWVMPGGAFLVTMVCSAIFAGWHRNRADPSEEALGCIRAAVESALIQTTPLCPWPKSNPLTATLNSQSRPDFRRASARQIAIDPIGSPTLGTTPVITVQYTGSGNYLLSSPADVGTTYSLEASLDLRAWLPVSTNIATSASLIYAVSNSPTLTSVYYRLRATPVNPIIYLSPTDPNDGWKLSKVVTATHLLAR
jgi:hypothetical protein